MKITKLKALVLCAVFLLILCVTSFFYIENDLPKEKTISKSETGTRWINKNYRFLLSAEDEEINVQKANKGAIDGVENSYVSKIYFFNIFPVKEVNISVSGDEYVTPGGECIGINLKTDGVLCIGTSFFESENGKNVSPASDSGIRSGDIIKEINGKKTQNISDCENIIENSTGEIKITGTRDGKAKAWTVYPKKDISDNKRKIGMFIRESVAGIGTLSFYCDNKFASLGHPISDADTGKDVTSDGGSICEARIIGIEKGKKGSPGSLRGILTNGNEGKITKNAFCGVYGHLESKNDGDKIKVASKHEVRTGNAKMRCDIGNGVESFNVRIVKLRSGADDIKSMVIEVTDKRLLNKTGGIVQGMSGSPIIQNGRLAAVLTHVFINDPKKGYAVFAQTMVREMKSENPAP